MASLIKRADLHLNSLSILNEKIKFKVQGEKIIIEELSDYNEIEIIKYTEKINNFLNEVKNQKSVGYINKIEVKALKDIQKEIQKEVLKTTKVVNFSVEEYI